MNCPNAVQELKWLSKQYKKYIISTKKAYICKVHKSIRNLRTNNPRDYWNIINDSVIGSSNKDNKIPLHDFQTHF